MYSPWEIFAKQVDALFEKDPEVTVKFEDKTISIHVSNPDKAEALDKLLPVSKTFGNITIYINVIPSNGNEYKAKYFQTALEGNEAFHYLKTTSSPFISNPITYCVFAKEVVQYPSDDIGDAHGIASTLYEDLARIVFDKADGIYFCTDME